MEIVREYHFAGVRPPPPRLVHVSDERHQAVSLELRHCVEVVVREVPAVARFREEHDNEEATDRWLDEEQVAPVSLAMESQLLGKRGLKSRQICNDTQWQLM